MKTKLALRIPSLEDVLQSCPIDVDEKDDYEH